MSEATLQPPGVGVSLGRYFITWLGFITYCIANIVDALWPLWDPKKQRLVDKVFKTVVITAPKQNFSFTPPAYARSAAHGRQGRDGAVPRRRLRALQRYCRATRSSRNGLPRQVAQERPEQQHRDPADDVARRERERRQLAARPTGGAPRPRSRTARRARARPAGGSGAAAATVAGEQLVEAPSDAAPGARPARDRPEGAARIEGLRAGVERSQHHAAQRRAHGDDEPAARQPGRVTRRACSNPAMYRPALGWPPAAVRQRCISPDGYR